jgi:hypothetical protein
LAFSFSVSVFSFQLFSLSLPLFMARVFAADHANHVLALHDSAAFTKSFSLMVALSWLYETKNAELLLRVSDGEK